MYVITTSTNNGNESFALSAFANYFDAEADLYRRAAQVGAVQVSKDQYELNGYMLSLEYRAA